MLSDVIAIPAMSNRMENNVCPVVSGRMVLMDVDSMCGVVKV
jgi:hypothetical protein